LAGVPSSLRLPVGSTAGGDVEPAHGI
jgi:hypothetical protein